MLQDLTEYMNLRDDVDPLIKLALSHYQFEAIHPFSDGNGRTGRLLNILFLVHHGLLELPVLYLSKGVIETKSVYYSLLREVTEKSAWESWVLYMLDAVEKTAEFTRRRILAIRALLVETLEMGKAKLPTRVYSKELIELIFMQPYTKVNSLLMQVLLNARQRRSTLRSWKQQVFSKNTRSAGRTCI